jgi:hypothetical protein
MSTNRIRRVINLAAWIGGALLTQALALAVLSLSKPDPAYGVAATFFLAGLFGIGSILCGLIGYAFLAAFRSSSASAAVSLIAGESAAILMFGATFLVGQVVPEPLQSLAATITCAGLGATSYALVNRPCSR